MNGVLNASDFAGADIGAQVNAAITQLGAAGGSIYIPAGSYNFANTIYIPRVVKLFGASSYGTVLNWTPVTGWAIVVADGYGTSIYPEGSIEDLKLVGPTSTDTVGAIYIGGSDAAASTGAGFPASPTVGHDPAANYGDHFNFNRLNISQFGVGIQWGNNGWSNTFLECCITSNATSIYFPNTTSDSGERLAFVGCSIQNSGTGLLMASGGSQVDVDFFFTACSFDFNAGNGSTTGWAINNLNAVWEVNLVNCHVEQLTQWLQNYGYCNLVACNFTNGTSSGTLGYLINNQIADGFTVHGGTFFNGGSGTILNTSSLPSLWVGALINGTGGTLASATGIIDPVGNSLFARISAGTVAASVSFTTGDMSVARTADTGAIFFGSSATLGTSGNTYWFWDGSLMNLGAGNLNIPTGKSYEVGTVSGVSVGPLTSVTGITTVGGIVTALAGAASDARLKTSIVPYEGGLDAILALSPIRYHWNEEGAKFTGSSLDKEEIGFTAQNIQEVLPEAITYEGNEQYLNFRDRSVITALVGAVKELKAEIDELRRRL
jgi:hypothetical protein